MGIFAGLISVWDWDWEGEGDAGIRPLLRRGVVIVGDFLLQLADEADGGGGGDDLLGLGQGQRDRVWDSSVGVLGEEADGIFRGRGGSGKLKAFGLRDLGDEEEGIAGLSEWWVGFTDVSRLCSRGRWRRMWERHP